MAKSLHISLRRVAVALVMAVAALSAAAFPADTYAASSVLAEGRWVKIGVEKTGLYLIPNSTLRSWGFNDPAKVRIHGYGGRRIDDRLTEALYVDDLPATASEATDAGVVFYGVGPDTWSLTTGTWYTGSVSPYTLLGYYFVTEGTENAPAVTRSGSPEAKAPATTGFGRVHHERELMQASEAGPLFVGEDFRSKRSQTFKFETPGKVADKDVWMACGFVHRHIGGSATVTMSVDGNAVAGKTPFEVGPTTDNYYHHISTASTTLTFPTSNPDGFELTLTYNPTRTVYQANLDYISINYPRELTLGTDGVMEFWINRSQVSVADASGNMRVWDVTNPAAIEQMETGRGDDGRTVWSASRGGMRSYVAWRPGATLPQPTLVGNLGNQNLHGDSDPVDMVIFAPTEFHSCAERIAQLHTRDESLRVRIVDPIEVYNEFSSGAPDVSGLRKYLKMVYDRNEAAGERLRYALLLGRPTLDQRAISNPSATPFSTCPWWVVKAPANSNSDNSGFGTDDFIAMLADNSGSAMGFDDLLVAVGRIPMTSVSEGNEIIDKLYQYVEKSKKTNWKNHLLILADDGDEGVHVRQADAMAEFMLANKNQQHVITKVYIGAYTKQNGTYPEARKEMFRELDSGVAWWCYSGHANNHSWTGDGMLTYTDLNNLYLRNVPFVMAATCDFLRWDNPVESGGEIMYKERNGGAIGMISATRPVYISNNAYFTSAFGRHVFDRDEDGSRLTAGEIYRRTKNDIQNSNGTHIPDENRLRFVFMGDPAMKIVTPDNVVELLTINGKPVDPENQITIPAMSSPVITGRIVGSDGSPKTDFDGIATIDIYDALQSRVIPTENDEIVFDTKGDKLFAGSAQVKGGEFTLTAPMPSLVADNFRPALMSMYAYATNSTDEAVGANRDFYVYGFEEPAAPDTTAPEIRSYVLNHSGFSSGERVNASPMVIAEIADNVGINLSTAGIGQQMTITLDGNRSFTDVASFYTPASDGSPSGVINYPFEDLTDGAHTVRLRVFDTSGNMAEQELEFFVDSALTPQIFDVFTDANPASESASFYVRHDRPENLLEVSITVYDLLGHPVWTSSARGVSDMDVSAPVTWDLCDMSGRRVNRGIYLYRATITTDDAHYETASRRIAVTAR